MRYIRSQSNNPSFNLAMEQYVFDRLSKQEDVFMLWQNDNSIIVGVNQNTIAEINASYVNENKVNVVRRLSGGGAMYQDLGNVNFTFISKGKGQIFDFSSFVTPIINALATIGIEAKSSGRNDVTIDGKKFSGNAQYQKDSRIMHHGTILFDSDLSVLSKALKVSSSKLEGKGVKSVISRVTNIRPYLKSDISVNEFMDILFNSIDEQFSLTPYELTQEDIKEIELLQKNRYATWEWNYGHSPSYTLRKVKRFDMVGNIEILLSVKESRIDKISFYGDYFGQDISPLVEKLIETRYEKADIKQQLKEVNIDRYFKGLSKEDFIEFLVSVQ